MIDIRIDKETGANLDESVISLGRTRACTKSKFTVQSLTDQIEYILTHESIHLVLDKIEGQQTSWLFDIVDYAAEFIRRNDIPLKLEFVIRQAQRAVTGKWPRFPLRGIGLTRTHMHILKKYQASRHSNEG